MECKTGDEFGFQVAAVDGRIASVHAAKTLWLWVDPVNRPGPEAMAVDEWLLENAPGPVLRVYGWSGGWGSLGYFGRMALAQSAFEGLQWVRRWTGGGIVDHRRDWTYTVVAPAGTWLAGLRGAESYRVIHHALARVLAGEGLEVCLSDGSAVTGAASCFANPVGHDLVGAGGRKLAGAGQRRGRRGLLHQGSLALPHVDPSMSRLRAECLAAHLADETGSPDWCHCQPEVPGDWISDTVRKRYGNPDWTLRR
jgi:lipoate-protein ligase A